MLDQPVWPGLAACGIGVGTFGMGGGNYPAKPGEVFGAPYRDDTDVDRHVLALHHSLVHGQTFIDTAAIYSNGLAEEIVGRALRGFNRCQLTVASKIRRETIQQPHTIVAATRGIQQRLGLGSEPLDLLYLHSPNYPGTSLEHVMTALNLTVELGLTRAIGACNVTLDQLQELIRLSWHPIVAVQNLFNPLYHHHGGNKATFTPQLQAFCRQQDILMVAHTPLHAGQVANHPELVRLATELNITPAQLALAWIQEKGMVPIPKASTLAHINENIAAHNLVLPAEIARQLDSLSSVGLPERGVIAPRLTATA